MRLGLSRFSISIKARAGDKATVSFVPDGKRFVVDLNANSCEVNIACDHHMILKTVNNEYWTCPVSGNARLHLKETLTSLVTSNTPS